MLQIDELTVSLFFVALSACICLSVQLIKINHLKKIILQKDKQINKIASQRTNDLLNEVLDVMLTPKFYEILGEIKQEIKTKIDKAVH